jgi:rfaE bifunctional protein nucleotidyltransferase chain/domain
MRKVYWEAIQKKIKTEEALDQLIQRWRFASGRIVFTNGCFDILHEGHLRYLSDARSLGDYLILGLNSDTSVSRLKGPRRPVNGQQSRALLLAGLMPVDGVVIFDEDTPLRLIERIRPDVLVKGGDWPVDQIVGAEVVLSYGGSVQSLPFHQGFSTTSVVERIQKGS